MQAALGKTSFHSLNGLLVVRISGFLFVAPVDDLVEQVGGLVVEGQIPDLVDAQ